MLWVCTKHGHLSKGIDNELFEVIQIAPKPFEGYPPSPNTNPPATVRFFAGAFCWILYGFVLFGPVTAVGHAENAPLHHTHPVPEVAVAEQQNELPNNPSDGRRPRYLMLIPS